MTPDPVATDRNEGDFNVSQVWLDALSRGSCDEDGFLRAIQMLTRRSPEAAWDSLALLDQYYRRGKIKPDVFKRVKSRLGSQLLGPALDVERSVPLRRPESPPAPAAVPPKVPPQVPASTARRTPPAPIAARTPVVSPAPVSPARLADVAGQAAFPSQPVRDRSSSVPMTPAPVPSARSVPISVERTASAVASAANRRTNAVKESDPREVELGDVLRGRYVIQNVLGLGGTGTVFEAIDRYRLDLPDSGQRVAVKVLHADTAGKSEVLTDLRREFQLLQSLSHPNIVRAHEYDRDGDIAFFTMEYLSGLSLESVLSAHREAVLERLHALIIVRDVAAALEHAHSRGVVHGDLNPGNIFITNDGEIRVLDFGAAHTPGQSPSITESAWDATAYAMPRYASCQLLDGERADVRDDTYSLACVLYVLLAGKHPFGELNAAQARDRRLKPARPANLTGRQWHALRAALSFDRQRRPADIAGWLEPFDLPKPEARLPMLLAMLKSPTSPRSRRGGAVALVLVILALAVAGWWASSHRDVVSQVSADAGGELNGALASAGTTLTRLWQQGRETVSRPPAADRTRAQPEPSLATPPPVVARSTAPSTARSTARSTAPSTSPSTSPSDARPLPAPRAVVEPDAPAVRPAAPPPAARAALPRHAPAETATSAPAPAASAQSAHARIELAADTVDVPLADPAARVLVRRTGNLRADVGFTWWTESGTAKAGQDFMNVKAHEEHFEDGKAVANLFVPVVADPTRREPKSFYIVINDPSDGASLGKRTLTMVTIPASE
jgi:serine/threonine protein kinase